MGGSAHRPLRIHMSDCPTVANIGSENLWSVSWNSKTHAIHLQISIRSTSDVIRTMLNKLAEHAIASDFRGFHTVDSEMAKVIIAVNNISRTQLTEILEHVRSINGVTDVKLTKVLVS